VEVKDAEGTYLATLQTGLPEAAPAKCAASAKKSYVVVSSVPVELPHSGGEGTISPHVVFRVIQGYKFFGSYGITNVVGGADSKACQLQNVVRGLEGTGNYSFSDVRSLKSFAPDEKVSPAKVFDTLDQAADYVNKGSEFANVQRMLMSLEIKCFPAHPPSAAATLFRFPHTPEIHGTHCGCPPGIQDRGRHKGGTGHCRRPQSGLLRLRRDAVRHRRR
jgi:hypothetical protein